MEKAFEKVGVWSFYGGLVIAIVAAVLSPTGIGAGLALLLGVLGIVVGLLNVAGKEVTRFLIASIAFIVGASSLSSLLSITPAIGKFIPSFLQAVVIFVAPSAAIVALRAIWDITKSK